MYISVSKNIGNANIKISFFIAIIIVIFEMREPSTNANAFSGKKNEPGAF
jgi:hypothetical protein